jgi:hypothetical protein
MSSKLAAFKIDRRRVSVSVFEDERLDYTGSRQLPSIYLKALDSAIRYVTWVRNTFAPHGVALENPPDSKTWKAMITQEIISELRVAGIPIFEIEKNTLIESFAHPPFRYRNEVRQVISSIWPVLATNGNNHGILDAAALGLYVQVEKTFAI